MKKIFTFWLYKAFHKWAQLTMAFKNEHKSVVKWPLRLLLYYMLRLHGNIKYCLFSITHYILCFIYYHKKLN